MKGLGQNFDIEQWDSLLGQYVPVDGGGYKCKPQEAPIGFL